MRVESLIGVLVIFSGRWLWGADAAVEFQSQVMPVLRTHCTECHAGDEPASNLDLSAPVTLEQLRQSGQHWFKVLERVEAGAMPPDGSDRLSPDELQSLAQWVRGPYIELLLDQQRKQGRSRLRRLSRTEYANTVYDLLGITPPVVRMLPPDGRVDGFDKVSTALPFSASSTEGHWLIAEQLVEAMLRIPRTKRTYRLWSLPSSQSKGHILELPDNWHVSFNTDTTSCPLGSGKNRNGFPGPHKPGLHRLRISAYAYQSDRPLTVGIYGGHVWAYPQLLKLLKVVEIPPGEPSLVETVVYLRTGPDSDGPTSDGIRLIPFGLGVQVPKNTQASNCKGPGLALQWVDVEELEESLPGQRLLLDSLPPDILEAVQKNQPLSVIKREPAELQAVLQAYFAQLGSRLYRRDLTDDETTSLASDFLQTAESGTKLKTAFINAVVGMMTTPDFLCIIEAPGKLDDFALASRLSYFLWNSTPDEELLEIARQGNLSNPETLRAQTERLLKDPKSDRFVNDFLDQWLGLWGIDNTTPDKDLYPEYDDLLKISSLMETRATFREMLDQNLSVRDFIAPDWALVNERLAQHYQLPEIEGFELQKVRLPEDSPFGGIWTQAATMKVTANGTLTSPVKRGVWVADRLLGVPIPPPPANISAVDPDTRGAKTLREQLLLHRQGACASCHALFDPYGFALESFDVMGNFRTHYRIAKANATRSDAKWERGLPVDCTGETPDGRSFENVQELRSLLARDPQQLARGVTRHLITYATGERAGPVDQPAIERIVNNASQDDYGLRSLIHGIIQSDLFQSK